MERQEPQRCTAGAAATGIPLQSLPAAPAAPPPLAVVAPYLWGGRGRPSTGGAAHHDEWSSSDGCPRPACTIGLLQLHPRCLRLLVLQQQQRRPPMALGGSLTPEHYRSSWLLQVYAASAAVLLLLLILPSCCCYCCCRRCEGRQCSWHGSPAWAAADQACPRLVFGVCMNIDGLWCSRAVLLLPRAKPAGRCCY